MFGTLDPGRREGLLPSLALGYSLSPFQGSRKSSGLLPLHFFFMDGFQSPELDWKVRRTGRLDLPYFVGAGWQILISEFKLRLVHSTCFLDRWDLGTESQVVLSPAEWHRTLAGL